MKKEILILGLLFGANSFAGQSMLLPVNCKITKVKKIVAISCSDGTSTAVAAPQVAEAPPTVHVKDANGVEYKNLIMLGTTGDVGHSLLNKTSGHVLFYSGSGTVTPLYASYYESNNCTGPAYASVPDMAVKNRILPNVQGWPGQVDAVSITGFKVAYTAIHSKFAANACVLFSANLNRLSIIEPTVLDASDLLTIALPLELVHSN